MADDLQYKEWLERHGVSRSEGESRLYYDDLVHGEKPGEYPFTRGIHPTMYEGRLWTMRQYAGFGSAKETNELFKRLLAQGTTGLSTAFDLPTQMGRDSDHTLATGEVGRVGVSISSIEDMQTLFSGIDLSTISTSMTINSTASILLAFYLSLAREQGISWTKLQGTVQNDILKEHIARGTHIFPSEVGVRIATDVIEFCSKEVPQWNPISISGYHMREAGCTAVQELAFTFANAATYLELVIARGIHVDQVASRLAFFFNSHRNFFEEIAKFRAARRIWATMVRERFGSTVDRSCHLRFHTQTAGSTLTAQQPYVNIVRTTLEALSAVLGGTQSLHTNGFDEALGLPTEESSQIALRTQQVLAYESGITKVVDPLGGSPFIEELTDSLIRDVEKLFERIKDEGGMLRAIDNEFPQREIEEAAYHYQQKVDRKEEIVVGVNAYQQESVHVPVQKISPQIELEQRRKLTEFKSNRDQHVLNLATEEVRKTFREGRNIMPSLIQAVTDKVTLGEISECIAQEVGFSL
jgi:methylmalonyl-CoA mutase, N-terminal domain